MGDISQLLSDKAYNLIKEMIYSSTDEEYISLRKTADELDMSYTPAREAFQRLEREGLLKLVPKVGYFVSRLDSLEVNHIFQVRECLENFVLGKVFDFIEEQQIKELNEYLEKQIKNYDEEDYKNYYINDGNFHLVFFKIYNNDYMTTMIKNVREKYLIGSARTIYGLNKHLVVDAVEEHKRIIESIKKGDKKEALEVLAEHIDNSRRRVGEGYFLLG